MRLILINRFYRGCHQKQRASACNGYHRPQLLAGLPYLQFSALPWTSPFSVPEREDFFGDVLEEERDDTSLVTIMETYHVAIQLQFPGRPIVNTLPRIFPEQDGPLPKFKFNWRDLGGGSLKTWLANPALEDATTLYLQKGAVEQTKPFTHGDEDTVTAQTWTGITMVGELEVLELRDEDRKTVARGHRDAGLVEPG